MVVPVIVSSMDQTEMFNLLYLKPFNWVQIIPVIEKLLNVSKQMSFGPFLKFYQQIIR